MIAVVGYGMGNVRSVVNALDSIGAKYVVVPDARNLADYDKALLPGVGAFGDCIKRLRETSFADAILEHVRGRGRPLLGICVGMQMLAEEGTEFGAHEGLGLVKGRVVPIPRTSPDLRLPHVGWNDLRLRKSCPLLEGLGEDRACYFVHSYHLAANDDDAVSADVDYGGPVTAAVSQPPVFGMQFHPEKSQKAGLTVLANFERL